tara:strand:- start:311 stop:1225 length:915 start_codon:yes stop_codon:yes gene_type:complete
MLWTEKYRPSKLNEIAGQKAFVIDAEHWVINKEMPNVLLYGIAGVGKTASAIALVNEILDGNLEGNFFEINASDDRKLDTVRTKIKEIASTQRLGDVPFKIILLDEMDGMTRDAQNALKRVMERYSDNVRFVITCNDRHRIIHPLLSRCANYQFKRLNESEMRGVLNKILQAEGHDDKFNPDEIGDFINHMHGDMRRAIGELQACVYSGATISKIVEKSLQPYTEILKLIYENDYDNSLQKVHQLIYDSTDMKTIAVNLHDAIISSDYDSDKKFKLLRVVGESEWRSNNMTPKVLASWMIGQMI